MSPIAPIASAPLDFAHGRNGVSVPCATFRRGTPNSQASEPRRLARSFHALSGALLAGRLPGLLGR